MAIDPNRLYSQLQNTGIANSNPPHYQLLRDMIRTLAEIVSSSSSSASGSSTTTNINNINQTLLQLLHEDGGSSDENWLLASSRASNVPSGAAVFGEVPSGLVNGSNTAFTTANNYFAGTLRIYLNGLFLVKADFTETGANTFSLTTAPLTGDLLEVNYNLSANTIVGPQGPQGIPGTAGLNAYAFDGVDGADGFTLVGPTGPQGAAGTPAAAADCASVYRATNQSVTNNVETSVNLSTVNFDTASFWSAGSPSKFTVAVTAKYYISGQIVSDVFNGTGATIARIYHNSTKIAEALLPTGGGAVQVSALVNLTATDTVELKAILGDNGASPNTVIIGGAASTFFSIQEVVNATGGGGTTYTPGSGIDITGTVISAISLTGALSGTVNSPISSPVNLTTDGTIDYCPIGAHGTALPRVGTVPGERLGGGDWLVNTFHWVGGGNTVGLFSQNNTAAVSATSATYTGGGALTNNVTGTGILCNTGGALNYGFSINAPCGKRGVSRRLRLYIGYWSCTISVTATLSDGSATPVTLTDALAASVAAEKMFEFNFSAGNDGQWLIVTATVTVNQGAAPNIKPIAATLS